MLNVLGSSKQLCTGLTRRDLLRVGGLGIAGLGLADFLRLEAASASEAQPRSFGRAKAVILLHLYGSPSQLEWADMKPKAPVEVRGELQGIRSNVPGLDVCELLPNLARVMDRTTVIRSMTHPHPIHGVAYAWTGTPSIDVAMELRPNDPRHWPFFASAVEYADQRMGRPRQDATIPSNVALPFAFSSRRVGEVPRAGPYAAFLGSEYNPVWTDFVGTATKGVPKTLRDIVYSDNDPYVGTSVDSHFVVPATTGLQPELTIDRLETRRSLLDQFDAARGALDQTLPARHLDHFQQTAMQLLASGKLGQALDVRRESEATREAYGHTLFGQACLAARRLVEAGSRVVSVFWDEFGVAGSGWDTHWNHYQRMREELCPGFDRAWYGLMTDLDERGMLDDVLVVCGSEHGRTPLINKAQGAGRDHWSRCYTTLVAGAGAPRGGIIGASDATGGDVADRPVSPKDLLATMYHLLGIDHRLTVPDHQGRPLPLVDGELIHELLA